MHTEIDEPILCKKHNTKMVEAGVAVEEKYLIGGPIWRVFTKVYICKKCLAKKKKGDD